MDRFSPVEIAQIIAHSRGRTGHIRITCPACSSERKQKSARCLSVSFDGSKYLFKCWHCLRTGSWEAGAGRTGQFDRRPDDNLPKSIKARSPLTAAGYAYLQSRKISPQTAMTYRVETARAYFPALQREEEGIAFPYEQEGGGHKVRCITEKTFISTPLKVLFGHDLVDLDESQDIVMVEGEMDVLSCYEASILNAVSVPQGAASVSPNQEQIVYLWAFKEKLEKARRILIAVDADEPGTALGEELARRIGRYKCWKVTFPDGCKDANDVLIKCGPEALAKAMQEATPWPVEGLQSGECYLDQVMELYEKGFEKKISTGMRPIDDLYSLAPGMLTVITGVPGNGKSTFVDQMIVNAARIHGYSTAICSFEKPPAVHLLMLSEMLLQKHAIEKEGQGGEKMTLSELVASQKYIAGYVKFLHHETGEKASIESIIERLRTAVLRWGVKLAVIDPYNYIQRPKDADSETQFIDDVLTRLKLTAVALGIHIWFVAHPTKMGMDADGSFTIPRGYSISGSSAWYSKADFGLTVHKSKDRPGEVKVLNWKTRFHWLGKEGDTDILFDVLHHTYITDAYEDLEPWKP